MSRSVLERRLESILGGRVRILSAPGSVLDHEPTPTERLRLLAGMQRWRASAGSEPYYVTAEALRDRLAGEREIRTVRGHLRELEQSHAERFGRPEVPLLDARLDELEADALSLLARAGVLGAGQAIPPRGARRDWLESLSTPADDEAALVTAFGVLHAIDLAHTRDFAGAFSQLADCGLLAPLCISAWQHRRSLAGGLKSGAARRADRRGKSSKIAPQLLAELQQEAAALRQQSPRRFASNRSCARELLGRCARSDDPARQAVVRAEVSELWLARLLSRR